MTGGRGVGGGGWGGQVTYEGDELVAVKITGDKNIPAGKVTRKGRD